MTAVRLDIHPHVISPDTDTYPLAPVGGKRSVWSADKVSLTPVQLVEAMDAAGVAKAALVHSSTTYGFDNSLVADAVFAFPDRFTGVCSVDVLAPDAVATLRHWLDRGCTGLRLFTTGTTMLQQADWLNDPATYPVWEFAAETGLPISIQARAEGMGMLRDLMDRFPAVPIVLDHLAHPDLTAGPPYAAVEPVLALASYRQLVVKYTPVILRRARDGKATPESFLPRMVEAFGADHIAWGSNYPASPGTLADLLAESEAALSFLSRDEIDQVMGGTAARLYPALAG
jgi:predicted TIM-barrel fold metal-dependent hydrolase